MQYGAHALCGSHSCRAALPAAALFCRLRRISGPLQLRQLAPGLLRLALRLRLSLLLGLHLLLLLSCTARLLRCRWRRVHRCSSCLGGALPLLRSSLQRS
jgi:hypothetical protein